LPQLGNVVRQFVTTTTPPKVKIFIVVSIVPLLNSLSYVFINREPAPFPALADWQIGITTDAYPFLEGASHIDCSRIIEANFDWLRRDLKAKPDIHIGNIGTEMLERIIALVSTSPVIADRLRRRYGFQTVL
jgi:hypothetical protein